ncbi:MAG TPA: DUF4293 domain-containing protein [Cyclobacteriaceae bacterium]|jgi:hypothetical protein|nr:DUF4293 domain-containing protein [Cyclobacteriaceae bacterium]
MWQRKQTIFLGITAGCSILMIFFPIWTATDDGTYKVFYPLYLLTRTGSMDTATYFPYVWCGTLAVAAATLAIIEIGKFENRLLQLKMGALNSLVMTGALGVAVYFSNGLITSNPTPGSYGLGLYLPAVAMISNLIANRFIRSDEKLVRDSERIR